MNCISKKITKGLAYQGRINAQYEAFAHGTAIAVNCNDDLAADGIIAKWFAENQKSQATIAEAVKAMPNAIHEMKEAAEHHHARMEESISKLVAIETVNYDDTNGALESIVKSAQLYLDHYCARDDITECKDLELCKSQLSKALGKLRPHSS